MRKKYTWGEEVPIADSTLRGQVRVVVCLSRADQRHRVTEQTRLDSGIAHPRVAGRVERRTRELGSRATRDGRQDRLLPVGHVTHVSEVGRRSDTGRLLLVNRI